MARAARLARDAIVARIDEADEFGRFLVEQGIAAFGVRRAVVPRARSEEHTSELQSLMRSSYAVFCLKKKNEKRTHNNRHTHIHINQNTSTTKYSAPVRLISTYTHQ